MTTIVRWNPLERMTSELGLPRVAPSPFSHDLDVVERDGKLHVRVDVPGVRKEDIHVEVHGGKLTISGERHTEDFGSFRRALTLPAGIEESAVTATHADGVLNVEIELPRKPEPARIEIR